MQNCGEGKALAINNGETIAIKVGESYFDITTDGEVKGEIEVTLDTTPGIIEGQGTTNQPFVIMSIEDLVLFSKKVNEGTSYSGKYVELGKTLDFNSDLSYVNPKTTDYDTYFGGDGTKGLKEQLTKGKGFVSIGNSNYFSGCFDGKNYEIKNIYENIEGFGGLFGYIRGNNAQTPTTIKNLTISGNITATKYSAGIVGEASYGYIILENLVNYVNVTADNSAGGITGRTFDSSDIIKFDKCINYGNITSKGATGGVVGEGYGRTMEIKNCANYGKVENLAQYSYGGTGGIMGGGYNPQVKIYNSYNCGDLLGNSRVAGIYGHSATTEYINVLANVYNVGKAEKYTWTPGGLAGQDSRFANVINSYYISTYQYGIGWGSVIAGTQYTEEKMKTIDFVNELNNNIEKGCPYEKENEDGTTTTATIDTIGWAKWVYNIGGYPTLDTSTVWDGDSWQKKEI